MMAGLRAPRLLPMTIIALAGLLAVKSSELVRAATGPADAATAATQVSTTPQATGISGAPELAAGRIGATCRGQTVGG